MSGVVHLVDRSTPVELMDQLLKLKRPQERILSLGPPPYVPDGVDITALHVPLGLPALAYSRLRRHIGAAPVVHAWSLNLSGPAARAAATRGGKALCSIHCLPTGTRREELPWLIGSLGIMLTVPGTESRETLLQCGADPKLVRVVPPAVSPKLPAPECTAAIRSAAEVGEHELLLTAPAEMTRGAGHKPAIWAYAIVRRVREGIRMVIPGDGALRYSLRTFAKSTGYDHEILFTGHRYSPRDVMEAADIALFCCEKTIGPGRPLEAMAAENALIATNISDLAPASCKQHNTALTIDEPSPQNVARAILRLVDSPDERARLAADARSYSLNNVADTVIRSQLDDVYECLR